MASIPRALVPLCVISWASAQDPAPDAWTPEVSMQYRSIGATALSPDGARVAFAVRAARISDSESEYRSHVWVARTDGGAPRQFTRGAESTGAPAFSPDGRWLAFTSARQADGDGEADDSKSQIWAMPVDGGEARPVTAAPAGVGSFRWSPDGSRIAYTMRDPETAEEKKRKKEKRDVELVDQQFKYGHLYCVAFAPESDEIPDAWRLTGGPMHVTAFDWAPSGDRIVFGHQSDPRLNTGMIEGDLSIVTLPKEAPPAPPEPEDEDDQDSEEAPVEPCGVVAPLLAGPGVEESPRWSPDGAWIAFVSSGAQPEPIGLGDLCVVSAAGGDVRTLPTPNRSASILGWAADSDAVFLTEALGTTRHVVRVPVDPAAEMTFVTDGAGFAAATALAADANRIAYTWQTPDVPADVWIASTDGSGRRQVSDLHADCPRPPMGETRLLSWQAPDGTAVEGLLTLPVGYAEGTRYPLVLSVHGGPAGVYSQTFTGGAGIYMLQTFAQRGYAVLRPNPRGSTGYGKDFRFANFRDWGYGDLSDLLAGCDHVIELGIADPERQFLMGWSYGGYMTSFAVTQTQRFRAASMGAGLPNLVSMVTTTDVGDYLAAHMGAEFWDDYAVYEKHSAIYHIGAVTTPTQVIHGAQDLRVPFAQGQEFYRALQRRGVPTEMVVYPRTPHGPREPKFLMDVSERILAWFAVHDASVEAVEAVEAAGG